MRSVSLIPVSRKFRLRGRRLPFTQRVGLPRLLLLSIAGMLCGLCANFSSAQDDPAALDVAALDLVAEPVGVRDIVLILDCSKSMNAFPESAPVASSVKDTIAAPTGNKKVSRLEKAQAVMAKLIDEIEKEGNARVALAAFAHRAEFDTVDADDDGKVDVKGGADIHPFTDYELLFPLGADKEKPSSKQDFELIRKELSAIKTGKGVTPLYYSVLSAAKTLKDDAARDGGEIIVFSDGVNFQGMGRYRPVGETEVTEAQMNEQWQENYQDIRVQFVFFYPSGDSFQAYLETKESKLRDELAKADDDEKSTLEAKLRFVTEVEKQRFELFQEMVKSAGAFSSLEASELSDKVLTDKVIASIKNSFKPDSASDADAEKESSGELVKGDAAKADKAEMKKEEKPDESTNDVEHSVKLEIVLNGEPLNPDLTDELEVTIDPAATKSKKNDVYTFSGLKTGKTYTISGSAIVGALDVKVLGEVEVSFSKDERTMQSKKVRLNLKK